MQPGGTQSNMQWRLENTVCMWGHAFENLETINWFNYFGNPLQET